MDTFDNPFTFNRHHLGEQSGCAVGGSSPQVAFAALCSHKLARSGKAETFRGCFMCLQLNFSVFLLAWHCHSPSITKICGSRAAADRFQPPRSRGTIISKKPRLRNGQLSFFFALFPGFAGVSTIVMVRPSILGAISTVAVSESSSAISLKSSSASSG